MISDRRLLSCKGIKPEGDMSSASELYFQRRWSRGATTDTECSAGVVREIPEIVGLKVSADVITSN